MNRLIQIDRRGVANDGLPGSGTDQRAYAVAETERHVEPSGGIPAFDEVLTPFLFDRATEAARCRAWHRSKRIAIEVDHAVRDDEAIAQSANWIARIARDARVARSKIGGRDHLEPHKESSNTFRAYPRSGRLPIPLPESRP